MKISTQLSQLIRKWHKATHVLFLRQSRRKSKPPAASLMLPEVVFAVLQKPCVAVYLWTRGIIFLPQQLLPAILHRNKLLHFLRMQSVKYMQRKRK